MKKNTRNNIIAVSVSVVFGVIIAAVSWPRGIQMVNPDGAPIPDLKVSLLRGNTWDDGLTDEEGVARFGRGFWRMPGQTKHNLIVVFDEGEILWEGVVKPDCLGVFEIPVKLKDK